MSSRRTQTRRGGPGASRLSNHTLSRTVCAADIVPQFNLSTPFAAANGHTYRPQDLYSHWAGGDSDDRGGNGGEPFSRRSTASKAATVVTAADGSHLGPLVCFLRAMASVEDVHLRVYNLGGLDAPKHMALMRAAGSAFTLEQLEWPVLPAFAKPNHTRTTESMRKGHYAWKVALIAAEVARTANGECLVYLDAEVEPSARLLSRFCTLASASGGMASPTSPGLLREWMHAGMPSWLERNVPSMHARATLAKSEQSCDAGMLAFIGGTTTARWLASVWLGCAMVQSCIAPDGSSRGNHRQDQSALSLFVYALQRAKADRIGARCAGLCTSNDQQLLGQRKGQRRTGHKDSCRTNASLSSRLKTSTTYI